MMHMTGMQVRAQDTATGSGEGDAPAVVGEDEPVDALVEEVEGGGDEVGAATTALRPSDGTGHGGERRRGNDRVGEEPGGGRSQGDGGTHATGGDDGDANV